VNLLALLQRPEIQELLREEAAKYERASGGQAKSAGRRGIQLYRRLKSEARRQARGLRVRTGDPVRLAHFLRLMAQEVLKPTPPGDREVVAEHARGRLPRIRVMGACQQIPILRPRRNGPRLVALCPGA
jgi:hypothetical protein